MKKDRRSKVSDLIKLPPVDQNAQTSRELGAEWGVKSGAAVNMIHGLIREGRVEQVRKRVDGRLVVAYRVKNK